MLGALKAPPAKTAVGGALFPCILKRVQLINGISIHNKQSDRY